MSATNYPWDHPGMVFCEGRYYDRTGLIALPECMEYPFGADITYLIWRFDDKPDEWIVTWRIRKYAWHNTDAFTGGDTKSWMVNKAPDVEKFREMFFAIAQLASRALNNGRPVQHDILEIKGSADIFHRIMQEAKPHWMHMQTHPAK